MTHDLSIYVKVPEVMYPTVYTQDHKMTKFQVGMLESPPLPSALQVLDRNGLINFILQFSHEVKAASSQFTNMMKLVCGANILQDTPHSTDILYQLDSMLDRWVTPTVPAIRSQTIAQGLPALRDSVANGIRQGWLNFIAFMGGVLNQFVSDQHVGLIDWFSSGECSYHYFHHKYSRTLKQEILYRNHVVHGVAHRETTRVRDTETIVRETSRYEHDLVDSVPHAINDPSVRVPRRLQPVLAAIPNILRPHAKIITGNQVYQGVFNSVGVAGKTTVEHDNVKEWRDQPAIEAQVWRPDPAIVLGDFVLGAWDESESLSEQSHSFEQQRSDQLYRDFRKRLTGK